MGHGAKLPEQRSKTIITSAKGKGEISQSLKGESRTGGWGLLVSKAQFHKAYKKPAGGGAILPCKTRRSKTEDAGNVINQIFPQSSEVQSQEDCGHL